MVASAFALAFDIVLRRDFKSAPSFAVPSMVYELMDAVEEPTKPSPANSVRLAKPPMEDWDGIVKLAFGALRDGGDRGGCEQSQGGSAVNLVFRLGGDDGLYLRSSRRLRL